MAAPTFLHHLHHRLHLRHLLRRRRRGGVGSGGGSGGARRHRNEGGRPGRGLCGHLERRMLRRLLLRRGVRKDRRGATRALPPRLAAGRGGRWWGPRDGRLQRLVQRGLYGLGRRLVRVRVRVQVQGSGLGSGLGLGSGFGFGLGLANLGHEILVGPVAGRVRQRGPARGAARVRRRRLAEA
eukprot:scaffold3371_cov33-Phaeocystis_antarctica.AAC.1